MKFKRNTRLIDHLIQALLIFTSVFLAFWLTEYREEKKKQEALDISLQHIALEMSYNHKRIEHIYSYYINLKQQIDSLTSISDSGWEKMYGYQLKNWIGMQTPMLRSTAYSTFLNKGIFDEADFETAKSLEGIYNFQSIIEKFDNSIFEEVTSDNAFTALTKIEHKFGIYIEILPQLIMAYQEGGKKILFDYGYKSEVTDEKLRVAILEFNK